MRNLDIPDWILESEPEELKCRMEEAVCFMDEQIAKLEEEKRNLPGYCLLLLQVKSRLEVKKVLLEHTELSLFQINGMLRDLPGLIHCEDRDAAEELLRKLETAGAKVVRRYTEDNGRVINALMQEVAFEEELEDYLDTCCKEQLQALLAEVKVRIRRHDQEESSRRVIVQDTNGSYMEIAQILQELCCMSQQEAEEFLDHLPQTLSCRTKGFAGIVCKKITEAGGSAIRELIYSEGAF